MNLLFGYSPLYAGLIAGLFAFIYLSIQSINYNLPPAMMISFAIAYITYYYQSSCDCETKQNYIKSNLTQSNPI